MDNPRDSQESKVTSTPQSASPAVFSLSPSISSIANEEPMDVDSEAEYQRNGDAQSSSEDVASVESANSSTKTKLTKPKNVKWTGFWSDLKPKNKDSLYYKIMAHPEELETVVIDFFKVYVKDEKKSILMLLQLFVDLCGYEKLQIHKVYKVDLQNANQIIVKMETEWMEPELKKSGKFLFMRSSKFEMGIDLILTEFLEHLVTKGFKSEVLFDELFMGQILEFLNCMSFSTLLCIRATGVILILKFLTAFVNLYSQFLGVVEDENGNISEKVNEKKSTLESFIDFLNLIYNKNCLIADKRWYLVKMKCAQEMYSWIQLFPEIFILTRRCLGRLLKLVIDQNELVRQTALNTCLKLVCHEDIAETLSQRGEVFFKIISTRFDDVNYKVAAKAIEVFTSGLERYSVYIRNEYKLSIIDRMFEKNLTVAQAAGKFLATYLYLQNNNDKIQVLKSLANKIILKREFAERVSFFLESCIAFIPELKDWESVVSILLETEVDFRLRKYLLEILNETVRYTLTGNFSNHRQIHIIKEPSLEAEDHVDVAKAIVSNFELLFTQFQSDKKCLKLLIELLTFINYEFCRSEDLIQDYSTVLSYLKDIFNTSVDRVLLEILTNIFSHFFEKQYFTRAHVVIEVIKNNCVQTLMDDLKQLSPTSDRNLLVRLRETSMRVSILFEKFNLTNILKWEDIFQVWDPNYLKVLKYLIVGCKWHLVWNLRQFIRASSDDNNTERVNHLLYSNCKDFVYACLDMLKNARDNSESFLIFETLCDLYAAFEKELKRKRRFQHFSVKITEPVYVKVLIDFVTRYVIENTKLLLEQRQKHLNKFVGVMMLGVVPVEYFSKILRFYESHYGEFGVTMDTVLHQLSLVNPALPLIIMHTLADVYTQILEKYETVNRMSDEAKHLQRLSKKFSSLKEIKSPTVLLKLVHMTIYFAFRQAENYNFLNFARYFAKNLKENDKSDAYHLYKGMIPEEDEDNEILLLFAAVLRPPK